MPVLCCVVLEQERFGEARGAEDGRENKAFLRRVGRGSHPWIERQQQFVYTSSPASALQRGD